MYKRAIRLVLEKFGLGMVRLRDPYADIARLVDADAVRTVIDGGAYHGAKVRRLAAEFPHARIHAFEPGQDAFATLQHNVADLASVTLHACALSDVEGQADFYEHDSRYMSSLLRINDDSQARSQARTVSVRMLDAVLHECGETGADVIKLDLQGNELAALQGSVRALQRCQAALLEVNFRPRYQGGCSFEALAGFMGAHGFHLYRLYEIASAPDQGWRNADALFVRAARDAR